MSKFQKIMGAHILIKNGYVADLEARGITKKDLSMIGAISCKPKVYQRMMEAYELDMNLDIKKIFESLNLKQGY